MRFTVLGFVDGSRIGGRGSSIIQQTMAASVYGGSPAHHNRIVHNSNGLSNAHNQIMSDGLSHAHTSFYHESAHYLPHHPKFSSLKHSTALSSIFVAQSSVQLSPPPVHQHQKQQQQQQQQHNQIPPILPKKTKKTYRTISGGTAIHSGFINDPHYVRNSKRKSAVELLAESKQYYVKSENVLDKKQQLFYQSMRAPLTTKSNSTILSSNACKFNHHSFIYSLFYDFQFRNGLILSSHNEQH